MSMKIRKNDTVKIMTGKDKGKTGKVVFVDGEKLKVTVEGINLLTRYERPKKAGQKGQKVSIPSPLFVSRVMLVCPHTDKPTRIGFGVGKDGKKVRISKRSGKPID